MSLKKLMQNYGRYNYWANQTIIDWLSGYPETIREADAASSFPSLRKTLSHLADTEAYWLGILRGNSRQPWTELDASVEQTDRELMQQSEHLADFIGTLEEADLLAACEIDAPWIQGSMPRYEFIQHCINHGAYHRGQIITIARSLGITDPPMTDYNYYNMSVVRKK